MLVRRSIVMATTLLLVTTRSLPAVDRTPLRTLGDGLFAVPVEIAGAPLHMLLDTGANRSLIWAPVAEQLHLTPRARFPLQTPNGAVDAVCAGPIAVRVGGVSLAIDCLGWSSELEVTALGERVSGVLGADALASLPVLLDLGRGRLVLGTEALAVVGFEVPLTLVEGRPAISLAAPSAAGEARRLRLVLDSGANDLVLFGSAAASARTGGSTRMATLTGSRQVETAEAPRLGGLNRSPRRAVLLPDVADRDEDGLLPLSAAGPVAFDWSRGVAILGARVPRGK